ncbi:hypothetical protein ASPBRDRAFT_47657 [Aspergillus brasiliensis CBS 101740]|uniref:Uncharacterized protein n=1 Tax=Aspergillus brasiliensis (strain CBS 101740 / IMI 381727 / IBT 21946) TaxID=767769 RepID=A0A1L9U7D7_ASPBC|nr:hypothetical protein ASPBRDRAFT_47657 [Aspergillus brasiliensis CBS 101740]
MSVPEDIQSGLPASCWGIVLERIPEAASTMARTCTTLHAMLYCSSWNAICIHDLGLGFRKIISGRIPGAANDIARTSTALHAILYCSVWNSTCIQDPECGFGDAAKFQRPHTAR